MTLRHLATAAILALGLTTTTLRASERRFAFSYETTGMPAGVWEYEQWLTWKSYDDKDRFDFRHEIEYGLSDTLTLDIYLADWRYQNIDGEDSETDYKRSGFALRQQLSDPNTSLLGSAVYGEVLVGDEELVLEGKVLLQKNVGPLVLVYNLVVEAEWEGASLGDLDESVGVWENTMGVSYQINPSLLVGLEALHEVEFAEWKDAGDHVLYVGPNVSYRKGNFFATFAGLFQTTGVEGEPDAQVRMIAGLTF
ncbi:MAG: hypothetical protein ACOYMN_17810 [Roseimicrobium sp.]